jgi:hypothetical protein
MVLYVKTPEAPEDFDDIIAQNLLVFDSEQ